ncbi:MAG: EamA family transporter, partial [Thermodesulfobacteriota bacterium]
MWFSEALAAAVLFSISGILFKANARDHLRAEIFFFCLYAAGSLLLLIYILATNELELNFHSIAAGTVIGIGVGAGNYLFARALKVGPICLTSPLIHFNVVFLVIGAVIYYGETLNFKSGLLVSLLMLSLVILAIDPNEKLNISSRSWYMLVIAASFFFAIRNGGLKVTNELGIHPDSVLFIGYLGPAIWFYFMKKRSGLMLSSRRSYSYG